MITFNRNLVLLSGLVALTSCVTIQNYSNVPELPKPAASKGCDQMVLPELKPIPEVPVLTQSQLSNRKETDRILIADMAVLRKQLRDLQTELRVKYKEHVESCMKNYGSP